MSESDHLQPIDLFKEGHSICTSTSLGSRECPLSPAGPPNHLPEPQSINSPNSKRPTNENVCANTVFPFCKISRHPPMIDSSKILTQNRLGLVTLKTACKDPPIFNDSRHNNSALTNPNMGHRENSANSLEEVWASTEDSNRNSCIILPLCSRIRNNSLYLSEKEERYSQPQIHLQNENTANKLQNYPFPHLVSPKHSTEKPIDLVTNNPYLSPSPKNTNRPVSRVRDKIICSTESTADKKSKDKDLSISAQSSQDCLDSSTTLSELTECILFPTAEILKAPDSCTSQFTYSSSNPCRIQDRMFDNKRMDYLKTISIKKKLAASLIKNSKSRGLELNACDLILKILSRSSKSLMTQ